MDSSYPASAENTHFMYQWGTFGIRLKNILDSRSVAVSVPKSPLYNGFLVPRYPNENGKIYDRRTVIGDLTANHYVAIGGCTLICVARYAPTDVITAVGRSFDYDDNGWVWFLVSAGN